MKLLKLFQNLHGFVNNRTGVRVLLHDVAKNIRYYKTIDELLTLEGSYLEDIELGMNLDKTGLIMQ